MTWAVRGRSSSVFGPSVWRGPRETCAISLTFDDGPSESTLELLDILARYSALATFFQCGEHVRRLPAVSRQVCAQGHEIGNHTDTHPYLCLKSTAFIRNELARAQDAIAEATGHSPTLFRPPFGVRWFGLREAQRELGLMSVMWTTIARDWKLPASRISARLLAGASNGAILCLHDGRQMQRNPNIRETLLSVREVLPRLAERGFHFVTVSDLLCRSRSQTTSPNA
jgi:peptidoglycan-N-acetylglucosamine deacetylase